MKHVIMKWIGGGPSKPHINRCKSAISAVFYGFTILMREDGHVTITNDMNGMKGNFLYHRVKEGNNFALF